MKKLSKATALLAAGTFLLSGFFMACTPHGAGGAFDTETPEPEEPEEDDGSPVDGTWDFTGTDTYSIGTNDSVVTQKDLANDSAVGATLSVYGNLKWGNGTDDASSYSFWFKKASAYEEGKAASKASGYLALTTVGKATLTIVYDAGGDNDGEKRWIAVCDSSDKPVSDAALISNLIEKNVYKTLKLSDLKKGSYKIYVSGTRIRSLAITNQAFEEKTKTVTNDVDTLGLVAVSATSDDETIATAAVTDAGIVITSKKEGSTVINAAKSETEIAKIKVTVSSTGAITTSIVKYEAFTEDTKEVSNDVATLGLVGASVTSDKDDYVKATLSDDKSKINIKSVAQADDVVTAKITVTDANDKTVTFTVTEARSGELTLGTITQFQRDAPVKNTDYKVDGLKFKAIGDNKDSIELSTSETFASTETLTDYAATLTDGTKYYVRLKAENGVYAESKAASFTANNGGSVNATEYTITASNFSTLDGVTVTGKIDTASTTKTFDDVEYVNAMKITTSAYLTVKVADAQTSVYVKAYGKTGTNGTERSLLANGTAVVTNTDTSSSAGMIGTKTLIDTDENGNIVFKSSDGTFQVYGILITNE